MEPIKFLDFLKNQEERIMEALKSEETFQDTQRYVNLMSVITNLDLNVGRLEALVKHQEEERLRDEEIQKEYESYIPENESKR